MAAKFLLTLEGTKQGKIKGSNTNKEGDLDFSKGLQCHAFIYGAVTPIDPNKGNYLHDRLRRGTLLPELARVVVDDASFRQ